MIKLLIDNGMPEAMAVKLPSQIRKGAPMHEEWKSAFNTGRFVQKLGRSTATANAATVYSAPTVSYKKPRPLLSAPGTVLMHLFFHYIFSID